jgi:hypothetical protein
MSISVTISKDDSGQFSVKVDQDATPDVDAPAPVDPSAPVDPNAPAPAMDTDSATEEQATPVKDLNQALELAGKILSQASDNSQSMFDQGMQKTAPQPIG